MQLLASALVTDAGGNFSLPAGSYSCPVAGSLLYVVATGGQVNGGADNSAISLITVPGVCSALSGSPTFVVNDLTTVGTVWALRAFLAPGAQLGSSATNAVGLDLGAATLASLVNLSAGTAPGTGFPANGAAPTAKLNSLANLLYGCTGSGASGSGTCGSLFAATTTTAMTPANTLDAALGVVNQPGSNVPALFQLSTAAVAFAPGLSAQPPDWTLPVAFKGGGMNGPTNVSIDGSGEVWVVSNAGVASLFSNTGTPVLANGITGYGLQNSFWSAVDGNGVLWVTNRENSDTSINGGIGSVTLLNSAGPALPGNSYYDTGGLSYPVSIAIDSTNTAWIVDNGDARLTLLSNSGAPLSGSAGYTSDQFSFPFAVAVDSKRNGWVANQGGDTVTKVAPDGSTFVSYAVGSAPSGVAIDAADNVWTANFYGNSVGLVSGGQVLSGNGYVGGGLDHPVGIAADGNGAVWVANYRGPGITEVAGVGSSAPGTLLSPTMGWAPDLTLSEAYGVAIDAAGNVWVASSGDNRVVEYVGIAAPVKTPLLGATRVP